MPRPLPREHTSKKPVPKYLQSDEPTVRQRSIAQEDHVASELSGRRQPGSGAFEFRPGDVITPTHLIECKVTGKMSYSVTLKVLEKIGVEAGSRNLRPALSIRFEMASDPRGQDWILVPLNEFRALTGG